MSKAFTIQSEAALAAEAARALANDPALTWEWQPTRGDDRASHFDATATLVGPDGPVRFLVELKLRPTARDVARLASSDTEEPILLVAPALPSAVVQHCREAGINCLDLNGRVWIKEEGVLVDRQPAGQPEVRPPTPRTDVFAPKSSRVPRTLLAHPSDEWRRIDLARQTGLSPAMITRIVDKLLADGILKEELWGALVLDRADLLLDAWREADDWADRTTVQQYSLLETEPARIAELTPELLRGEAPVFTQWFAASLRHPYTPPPAVSAYVRALPGALATAGTSARPVDNGGNLWLIVPRDEGVFFETQEVGGFTLACDAQIYLDLLQVGLRGPDQAHALRECNSFMRRRK